MGPRTEARGLAGKPAPAKARGWLTPRQSVHLLGISFMAITLMLFAGLAWEQHREAQREAVRLAASLAEILSGHAARLFDTADALASLGVSYGASSEQNVLNGMLGKSEYLHALWRVDQQGVAQKTASVSPAWSVDPAAHRRINDKLKSGETHAFDLITTTDHNATVLLFARRIADDTGAFRGSTQVAIDPGYFENFYRTIQVSSPVVINLFRADLSVLIRHPMPGSDGSLLKWPDPKILRTDSTLGVIDYLSEDGLERRVDVFRRVSPFPVYVSVGFAHQDILAAWARHVVLQGAFVVTALAGLAVLLNYGVRCTRREERVLGELESLTDTLESQVEARTAELSATNSRLTALLAEKEILVREVNHRVKNSLQLISSLLDLQSHHAVDPSIREELAQASRRVRTVARMHQRLYLSEKADVVDFEKYLRGLCADLTNSMAIDGERHTVTVKATPAEMPIETAISIGLVAAELLTNALRHAYPRRPGKIEVDFRLEADGTARLAVRDQGIGLPQDYVANTAQGGIGMRLVNALVQHHDGHISMNRGGPGLRAEVIFPPSQPSPEETEFRRQPEPAGN